MNSQSKAKTLRMTSMVVLDIVLVALALLGSALVRFDNGIQTWQRSATLRGAPGIVALYAACLVAGGVYRILWKYASVRELIRLTVISCVAGALTIALNALFNMGLSRGLLVMTSLFSLALTGGWRILLRVITRQRDAIGEDNGHKVLILGAGMAGAYALSECQANPARFGHAVGLLDDDPGKLRMHVHGVAVLGRLDEVGTLCESTGADTIIIAMPSVKGEAMRRIVEAATETKRRVFMFSSATALNGNGKDNAIRELNVADFLPRKEVKLDEAGIRAYIEGKTVLVTGGGGSIGSEICRQLARFAPAKLLIFDIYENCAYELLYDLRSRYGKGLCPVEILVGSIRDKARLKEVFSAYKPQVVFHAAAHKHVPLMEVSPAEAVKNNVLGTRNLLQAASESGVERLVQLSTDKAVNPTNVMGATKRVTEMLIQLYARSSKMKCMAVRFGNVLGSHGSVIPLWEQQIRRGGPVTVVDPGITRYFMTIPEAAQLVLQAGCLAESGAIYVLDMGTPCNILELAKKLIRFYGYEPNVDIPVQITGLRVGEKMYEELLMDSERDSMTRTAHDKIFVAPPIPLDEVEFERSLQALAKAAENNDERVVEALAHTVSTYTPNRQKAAI